MPILKAEKIFDKPGYLAEILSKPCAFGNDPVKCALTEWRKKYAVVQKYDIERHLMLLHKADIPRLIDDCIRCYHAN